MRRPKILMLTRLFPSRVFPTSGTFCAERARALARYADVRVIVPTPYFPRHCPGTASWRRLAAVEREGTTAQGLAVSYPRFISLPKFPTWTQGGFMAHAVRRDFLRWCGDWIPDVIDSHCAFPDGYAGVRLAGALHRPALVTCHGSDLRQYPSAFGVKGMIGWTFQHAARVISVSTALRRRSVELGCAESKAIFLTNGVDADRFLPRSKQECRTHLGLPPEGDLAACVGHLIPLKNQGVLIRALGRMRRSGQPAPRLALVGEGPGRAELERLAIEEGVAEWVHFAGRQAYDEVPYWMAAADWLALPSHHEGWPTVYFEAMACGRPVLTSAVPPARDAVTDPAYGMVVDPNTPEAWAQAFASAASTAYDQDHIRRRAQGHTWDQWARDCLHIVEGLLDDRGHP